MKKYTDKTRIRFWACVLALIWLFLATKMGVEATIALINKTEMYNWKNGMMSPQSGFVHMGIFLVMAIAPICIAIWPCRYIKYLKNRTRTLTLL